MSGSRGDEIDPSALLVHTEDIVAVVDVGGGVRYANDATRRMLGWQAGDVASVFERVHPDDVAPLLGALGELVDDTGSPTAQRARVRHADGEWRWLEILAVNRLDDPAVGGIVLSCRDVTGHVESEAARARRREADELLATLAARFVAVTADDVDAVIDGVLGELAGFAGVERGWVSQLRGDELEITHDWWAEGLPGLSPDQRRLRMADHPGLIAAFARNDLVVLPSLDRLAAGPDRTLLESQRARSLVMAPLVVDGERRGLVGLQSVRSEHPWPDDVRHVLGAVAALLGATLRRVVAEAALATSEARFRALLAHTAEGVRLLDADMRTIWASPWAAMMHGTGHLVHDPDDRLAMVHPDDRDTVARARADVL
ncbi:MAG TPA: PAS domain S-box protein, partial [Acidimicrobiales bacterium]|nr:PAS domain S-box protein [Acidimicrobiales bacterium]